MKTIHTLAALVSALSAWSDGPKYVVIHPSQSATNYEALKTADQNGANVLISTIEMTADFFARMINSKPGSFFIVGEAAEREAVAAIVASRPDLDIVFSSL